MALREIVASNVTVPKKILAFSQQSVPRSGGWLLATCFGCCCGGDGGDGCMCLRDLPRYLDSGSF